MNEDSVVYDEWGRNPDAPFSVWLGGMVIAGYLKAVCATSSKIVPKTESNEKMSRRLGEKFIWALWHHHLGLPAFFNPNDGRRTCMASKSRDGELLAQVMFRLDTHCVRGSSSALDGRDKGGAAAVRQMIRVARQGEHQLVVTPDGPKGPPQKVKMGVITLASLTGYPICPVAFAASRFFTIPRGTRRFCPCRSGKSQFVVASLWKYHEPGTRGYWRRSAQKLKGGSSMRMRRRSTTSRARRRSEPLMLFLYNVVILLISPVLLVYFLIRIWFRGFDWRAVRERFGFVSELPDSKEGRLWLHAVSVGEVAWPPFWCLRF